MAEKSAGAIVIDIAADITKLKKDMEATQTLLKSQAKNLKTQTDTIEKGFGKINNGIQTAMKAAVAFFAIKVGTGMIKSALDTADALAKQSAVLGVGAKDLLALKHAADLSGVSAEQLNTAMRKMTIGLGQAQTGTGTAVKALELLNVKLSDIANMSATEQMAFLNAKIKETIPASMQASVAADLFGSKTAQAMLNLDSGTIEHAAEMINKYNVALSDVEYKQIEQANDAVTDMKLAYQSITQQMAAAFGPTLQWVAEIIGDVASDNLNLKQTFKEVAFAGVQAASLIAQSFLGLKQTLLMVETSVDVIQEKYYEARRNSLVNYMKILQQDKLSYGDEQLLIMGGIEYDTPEKRQASMKSLSEDIKKYSINLSENSKEIEQAREAFQAANQKILDIQNGALEKSWVEAEKRSAEQAQQAIKNRTPAPATIDIVDKNAAKKAADDAKKAVDALNNYIEETTAKTIENKIDKEIYAENQKYWTIIETHKLTNAQKSALDDEYLKRLQTIQNEEAKAAANALKEYTKIEVKDPSITEKYNKQIADAKEQFENLVAAHKFTNEQIEELEKAHNDKLKIINDERAKENYNALNSAFGVDTGLAGIFGERITTVMKFLDDEEERINEHYKGVIEGTELYNEKMAALDEARFLTGVASAQAGFSTLAGLFKQYTEITGNESKTAGRAYKAFAIAEATVSTYLAAQKAYASAGNPYLGAVLAALAVAQGMMNVANIKNQKFHSGGLVTGTGDEVPAILQTGEGVISRRGMRALDNINGGNIKNSPPEVNITVANLNSADEFEQFLQSRRGQEIIQNIRG